MKEKIRWGIVGLGKIAHNFARDLQLVNGGKLQAVASRDLERAEAFGRQYEVTHCYGNYEELFESDVVDVIYVATPHTSHAAVSIAAMNRGKHVLCEKPLGVNTDEVEQMIAVAERNKVFLMEALWSRFNPSIREIKALVDDGVLGQLGYLYADFGFYALDKAESGRLLNPDLAGGSLLDIGIYPIFLAYLILGKPREIKTFSNFYKTGVEIQTAMIFDYPQAQAVLYSGLVSKTEMKAEISGSKGSIFIHPRWHEAQGYSMEQQGEVKDLQRPTTGEGYTYEIEEVHKCLKANRIQSALWSHQDSIALIQLMDEIRAKNKIVFPFES